MKRRKEKKKMGMTKNQQLAVNSEGNVIVSAGAGSGKTFVLTSRVLRKVNEGVNLDEFLILTFTNAAAKEMRTRIKRELIKNNRSELVNFVDSSHIETFDAYALYIVKKYGYLINLPQNINNVPEDIIKVKLDEIINRIFDDYYKNKNETFVKMVHEYCNRDDENLSYFFSKVYYMYSALTDKETFLKTYNATFLNKDALLNEPNKLYESIKKDLNILKDIIDNFEKDKLKDFYNNTFYELFNANDLKNFCDIFNKLKFRNPPIKKEDSDREIRDRLLAIYDKFKLISDIDVNIYRKIDVPHILEFVPFVLKTVVRIDEEIREYQISKGYFTFTEIANYAFKIIQDFVDVRESIKNKIKVIFIDEYQDTSDLQEQFVNLISSNNVFSVGDVKQSIYLFRGANPSNFVKKYDNYKNLNCAIDMVDNFRSRKEVVEDINEIFNRLMTKKFGGADYSVNHNFSAGNTDYETIGKIDKFQHGIVTIIDENSEIDNVILDIKKRICNHQTIFDRSTKTLREVTYKDFAILSPRGKRFLDYEEILLKNNIPVNAVYDEKLLDDDSITVLVSLLKIIKLINNGYEDKSDIIAEKHYYLSIARSFLYEIRDEILYDEIINNLYKNNELYKKIQEFAYNHRSSTIENIFTDLINEFNFVHKLVKIPGPLSKIDKMKLFYDRTKVMDQLGFTLDEFISYIENINNLEIPMTSRHEEQIDNAVTLTTIHKSKGLEYKIVYLIELSLKKNNDNDKFFIDSDKGIWPVQFCFKKGVPLQAATINYNKNSKLDEERLRLFYVGLTRAEDTCVLVLKKDSTKAKSIEECNNINDLYMYSGVKIKRNEFVDIKFNETVSNKKEIFGKQKIEFRKLNDVLPEYQNKYNAAKELNYDVDISKLNFGTHMHLLMEVLDFYSKDTSFIKDKFERKMIDNILKNELFNLKTSDKIFKEYQFIDKKNNHSGVIDLLVVHDNYADVIDYKLKNIGDDEYINQLNTYKLFVEEYFKIKCKCYLVSLLENDIKEVY